ncbi:MAG: hypothetical protein LBU89_11585 [Fibromonadaceae bacterium]|jgi:uncharacterized membrane protein YhaH (DUF805 family)|nr:hypothetical protein [Fibromonadaceae bacterium]
MKESLLKWLQCLYRYKGTTYGYASRKDFLIVFGFNFLFVFVLSFLYHILVYATLQEPVSLEQEGIINVFSYFIIIPFMLFTTLANLSLFFMRVNDIFGRRYFTTKKRIFAYFAIAFFIEVLGRFVLMKAFSIEPIDSSGWFGFLIAVVLCAYPSPKKEKEDAPVAEYKLPKKGIVATCLATIISFCFSLYLVVEISRAIEEKITEENAGIELESEVDNQQHPSQIERGNVIELPGHLEHF